MARMRYIKPEFWTDSVVVSLSMEARLLYIGTWNFALCDHGHLEDDALQLKMKVFPADNIDVPAALSELVASGRVRRLTGSDGRKYLHVVHLNDHQKTDPRFTPRCPACKDDALTCDDAPSETLPSLGENTGTLLNSPTLSNSLPQEGKGGEGKGRDKNVRPIAALPDTFEDWYSVYKRKEGRGDAVKAYAKAIKIIDPDELKRLTVKWFADRPTIERKFIPLPASWLNGQRWDDDAPGTQGDVVPGVAVNHNQWMFR